MLYYYIFVTGSNGIHRCFSTIRLKRIENGLSLEQYWDFQPLRSEYCQFGHDKMN